MSEIVFAYMTTRSRAEARELGRALVEKKLAACVNFWDGMESVYSWEGKIEIGRECVVIAKTTTAVENEFLKFVRANHSYQVPCVVFLPTAGGNPDYLRWLDSNVVG